MTYTLTVAVGFRQQAGSVPTYSILLGTTNDPNLAIASTPLVLADRGKWTDVTLMYTHLVNDANVGSNLKITLKGLSTVETGFDNVRLDGTSNPVVPEPATMSLLGGSLLALIAYRRKRAQKA
jgi:hypothetical protein